MDKGVCDIQEAIKRKVIIYICKVTSIFRKYPVRNVRLPQTQNN